MQTKWFETFFRGIALDMWRGAMTPEATSAEADFLETLFAAGPGARMLDVPCGNGRHSIELARRGHRLTGVDLSEEFLSEARNAAAAIGIEVEWRLADMRNLDWGGGFDGVFCFGNSFGYLDPFEAGDFIRGAAQALRSGGRVAIETGMAAESILAPIPTRRWHLVGNIYMLSDARYHPLEGRLDIDYTFIRGGEIETRPASSYVLTVSEMRRMLESAGFEDVTLWGGIHGEEYRPGSPRLILTARKS